MKQDNRLDFIKKMGWNESNQKTLMEFYSRTYRDFKCFLDEIFSIAIKKLYNSWISGPYVYHCADLLQLNRRTMYVGPRQHFKSVRFYAYIMWQIWRNLYDKRNIRINYFSYNQDLAEMHTWNIKQYVLKSNFPAWGLIDNNSTAKSLAEYTWNKGSSQSEQHITSIKALGIMGGVRGEHSEFCFIDDPYRDDRKDKNAGADPNTVIKINGILEEAVFPIPTRDGEMHIIGTPQSFSDVFFQEKYQWKPGLSEIRTFKTNIEPVYIYGPEGRPIQTIWPEAWALEDMLSIESTMNPASFAQEYLCQPRTAADIFFNLQRIETNMELGRREKLFNYDFSLPRTPKYIIVKGTDCYGGYDPGKSKHPAHFVVFRQEGVRLVQLLSKWMDKWDYSYDKESGKYSQLSYIQESIPFFGIRSIFFDNTRGELEQTLEQNKIPELVPFKISRPLKNSMAVQLEDLFGTQDLLLLDDERQKRGFLAVKGDLDIVESSDNHGESFTTVGLVAINTIRKGKSGNVLSLRSKYKVDDFDQTKYYRGYF
jgi:hypothetical protein